MGSRVQVRHITARLAARFLLIFAAVLVLLSIGAYEFVAREYGSLLAPALGTAEGTRAFAAAMRRVTYTIIVFDIPLLILVGAASWLLAAASVRPLIEAVERERAFAVDAAHALRSPLTTIASVAQAARGEDPHDAMRALDVITHASLDASSVVADLLTLARGAHAERLSREPVDVAAIAADASGEFEAIARRRGISLNRSLTSAIVNGDERRLRELVRNLLDNATRYARSTITVSSRPNGRWVELSVFNDGDPIAPELQERIFERFYTENGAQGSGLGLAIVRWIAQAHGGNAFVRPGGGGSPEFIIRLPAIS